MVKKRLEAIDGETLMEMDLPPTRFCVRGFLPQGIAILGGAPKTGKSWLALDLCVRVAKGQPLWGMQTTQGTVVYLCLEDSLRRIRDRIYCIAEDVPRSLYFSISAGTVEEGLCEQVMQFLLEHQDTVLVVIDIFQMVRGKMADLSYASDYDDIQQIKKLADEYGITILLVHHLRKQGSGDPLNRLSGTTGISGAVDAVFILDKGRRSQQGATMVCTGRDIEYRELDLRFRQEDCVWELIADSAEEPALLLPAEMAHLIEYISVTGSFSGSSSELAEELKQMFGDSISAKGIAQAMNKWETELLENGVSFRHRRSNGKRIVEVFASESAASDVSAECMRSTGYG